MIKTSNSKQYDLEERTLNFAKAVRDFVGKLPKMAANFEYIKQLIRSSGSVGANYIEAKESRYWLNLMDIGKDLDLDLEREELISEATQLTKIFGSIVESSK
ncbi:hypothetical protein A2V54_00075 [candidate division WWE3 bacterium RBG_19FT_COMBO_53_11]|uniref:Four helix bundle protein n=1 Tax=candidate division WWE3 bacterium RBG_19FT_COMBO_53_11 TaxID=1802613 RepID=A0A1F4UHZ7_UNCKA|nr:MAG: hypothetical protein A2155_02795 [candidate division WWE3 bacterium RBG_16_52_45]OGC44595.1 MAG: hypothetical protein A2V54_00075 [candidate division WWE3 bacterium RBG_19FT_COMBO_53_11]